MTSAHDLSLLFYEKNGGSLKEQLEKLGGSPKNIGIFIGPEGGFEEEETKKAEENGIILSGMGPRILRTETAPLCALSCIMFATGNI
jgi:16S rRNA (uracil1498-N3)-methyltransferase